MASGCCGWSVEWNDGTSQPGTARGVGWWGLSGTVGFDDVSACWGPTKASWPCIAGQRLVLQVALCDGGVVVLLVWVQRGMPGRCDKPWQLPSCCGDLCGTYWLRIFRYPVPTPLRRACDGLTLSCLKAVKERVGGMDPGAFLRRTAWARRAARPLRRLGAPYANTACYPSSHPSFPFWHNRNEHYCYAYCQSGAGTAMARGKH